MSRPFLIHKIIRMLMIDRDLRISDLARFCDTTERNIYFVLQGNRKKRKHEPIIANALGISEELLSKIISDFKGPKHLLPKDSMGHKASEA